MSTISTTGLRSNMRRFGQQIGMSDFLDWWLGELSAAARQFLPDPSGAALAQRTLVKISGNLVIFSRTSLGQSAETGRLDMSSLEAAAQGQAFLSELARSAPRKGPLVLQLAKEQVLCKKFTLPLAAEENLREVVGFELDRHTPFNAAQVYFDFRAARRDQQIEITLAVVPRDVLDERLRKLAAWGVQPDAVMIEDGAPGGNEWNLLPGGTRKNRGGARPRLLNMAWAAGAIALLAAALALPVWQKRETVLALQPLVAKAHGQAANAEKLRLQIESQLAEYNYIHDKKLANPPLVAVLDDVARVLPDDTWVQQFELKGNEMKIHGETASSSKLVGLFEQARTLHDASFRAPLTKGQGANSERFQLAAETRALPQIETAPLSLQQAPIQKQAAVTRPAPGPAATDNTAAAGAQAEQEKDKASKQPAIPEAIKPGSSKAAAAAGNKTDPAQENRTEGQR